MLELKIPTISNTMNGQHVSNCMVFFFPGEVCGAAEVAGERKARDYPR